MQQNQKDVTVRVSQWQNPSKPLAPLTEKQSDCIYDLSDALKKDMFLHDVTSEPNNKTVENDIKVETNRQFVEWNNLVISGLNQNKNTVFSQRLNDLHKQSDVYKNLLAHVDDLIATLSNFVSIYNDVRRRTNLLHTASEELLTEHHIIKHNYKNVMEKLYYFTLINKINQTLLLPTLSVSSETFNDLLNKIDEGTLYLTENSDFKESYAYLLKYKQNLSRAMHHMRVHITKTLTKATDQILETKVGENPQGRNLSFLEADSAFALYYGKYRSSASKVKSVIEQIELRISKNPMYGQLLSECEQMYFVQRQQVMANAVANALKDVAGSHKGDHSSLFRSSCAFTLHVCQDEIRLYNCFFSNSSEHLNSYLEKLCANLYDSLRPYIIHINHLETLAELCSILRVEMLDEHSEQKDNVMEPFRRTVWQLLQDVQERLVFRTNLYLQTDLLNYKPSPGDLAYPEKLQMMESIAQSLQEASMRRSESRSSELSSASMEKEREGWELRSRTGNSPADLHGMWYPTVKRTLVCLSRLYRCVDRPIFQGLSQEALSVCIQTINFAAQSITSKKTAIDGTLFQIKHLLILREQIAPFQVDFTIKEMSLDFSKMKTAAFELLQKKGRLFALGTNNALLEFLLEGTPQVKEQLVDSRKEVDKQLKLSCEEFIKTATDLLIHPLSSFIATVQEFQLANNIKTLCENQFANAEAVAGIVQEVNKAIKNKLGDIQRSMQLYLANRETEFVLFRPIKNNIIGSFVQLEQILSTGGYSSDDMLCIGCPTAEQVSLLVSSSSLVLNQEKRADPSASTSKIPPSES